MGLGEFFGSYADKVREHLENDLDTPKALAILNECAAQFDIQQVSKLDIPTVRKFVSFIDDLLGVCIWDERPLTDEQKQIILNREAARQSKDWAKSDELRDRLTNQGIAIRDTETGTIWHRI
jgi:cysteinyl-tRNA synthetase